MTVSKTAAVDLAKASRRKEPAEGAVESTALQMGELSELLGYSLKRAQLRVFEDFLRCVAPPATDARRSSRSCCCSTRIRGRNQTEIANTLGILRPNFVAMLDGLESRDLWRADAFDQRSPLPHPCPDRQRAGRCWARREKKAGRHQARSAVSTSLLGPRQTAAALLEMLAKIAERVLSNFVLPRCTIEHLRMRSAVIARSVATKQSTLAAALWIASLRSQ